MSYPVNVAVPYAAVGSTPGYLAGDHTIAWSFDDSTTATGASVNKTWTTTGPHMATATATNTITGGTGSASKSVYILTPPSNLLNTVSRSRQFQSGGDISIVLGSGDSSYLVNKLASTGTPTKYSTAGFSDGSNQDAINSGNVSADISSDGTWVVFGGWGGAAVASRLVAFNTSSGVVKSFDMVVSIATHAFPEKSAMIVARSDGKFAVSVRNDAWQEPFTFIYDPVTNASSGLVTGSYAYPSGLAMYANDGNVYCLRKAWGGNTIAKYNVAGNSWSTATLASTLYDGTNRLEPSVVKMADGKFLLIGGYNSGGGTPAVSNVAIFDPVALTITDKTSLNTARYWPATMLLSDGRVLVAGGLTGYSGNGLATAEVYDPVANTWTALSATMIQARGAQGFCVMPSGNLAMIGGVNGTGTVTGTVEYFHPGDMKFWSVD